MNLMFSEKKWSAALPRTVISTELPKERKVSQSTSLLQKYVMVSLDHSGFVDVINYAIFK